MNNPKTEALKEISRWVALYIVSWIITQMLSQINLVVDFWSFKVSVFTFTIPVRTSLNTILTLTGRYVDKYVFVSHKNELRTLEIEFDQKQGDPTGLLPF